MASARTKRSAERAKPEAATFFRIGFELSISSFSGDPSDYIMVYDGKVIETTVDDDEKEIGTIILYLVERTRVINERRSLFDVMDCLDGDSFDCFECLFDQDTETLKPEVEQLVSENRMFQSDLLLIERLELLPEYRGRGIGKEVALRAIQKIGENCGVIACIPVPLQFSTKDNGGRSSKEFKAAERRVRAFWEGVGFVRVKRNDYFVFAD